MNTTLASLINGAAGRVQLQGELVAESVPQLYREGRQLIDQSAQPLQMDLAEVVRADSAGLALLVDWLAYAARNGKSLGYMRLPPMLTALAGLSEVTSLLEREPERTPA